jgi:DNA-binding transcriptional MerR regulator
VSLRDDVAAHFLTLKEMVDGSGCTPRTVRYYERQGLLRATRTPGGHRQFPAAQLERLLFVVSLREAGWSLEAITELLELRDGGGSEHAKSERLAELLRDHLSALDEKIAVLQRLRDDLAQTAELVPVCVDCTSRRAVVSCERCEHHAGEVLPAAFRLVWRGGGMVFDNVEPSSGRERA